MSNMVLSELAPLVNAQHGVCSMSPTRTGGPYGSRPAASYASATASIGEQVPPARRPDRAVPMRSRASSYRPCRRTMCRSLDCGELRRLNVIVLPALFEGDVNAVIELASFSRFSETHQSFLKPSWNRSASCSTHRGELRTKACSAVEVADSRAPAQQGELKKTNDRLESQATTLRQS